MTGVGGFTVACRSICSVLVAAPLLYWISVTDGDVYHFLVLVLLAPVAGAMLFANSLFCLFRHPGWRSFGINLVFMGIATVGVLVALYFLPQFRMH